jgi:dihydrodipicolinate synthase/N-acetylneuraminate lyase
MKLAGMDSGQMRLPLWEASDATKRAIEEAMKRAERAIRRYSSVPSPRARV